VPPGRSPPCRPPPGGGGTAVPRTTVDWCVDHDLDAPRDYYRAGQATCHFEQGRWPEAAELVAELTRPGAGTYLPAYRNARRIAARLAVRRGGPHQTAPLAEVWRWAAATGDPIRQWPVAAVRAEAAWHAGRAAQIPDLVGEVYRGVLEAGHPWAIGELAYWMWRAGALAELPTARPSRTRCRSAVRPRRRPGHGRRSAARTRRRGPGPTPATPTRCGWRWRPSTASVPGRPPTGWSTGCAGWA